MPHSIKSEQALLGCILSNTETIYDIDTHPKEFYKNNHQALYEEIKKHSSDNQSWDSISLYDHLSKEGKISDIGGISYYMELQEMGMTSVQLKYYAKQVKEMYDLREEIRIYRQALEETFKGTSQSDGVIAKLMGKPLVQNHSIDKIVDDWKLAQTGNRTTIPTPYETIDRQTGGIKQGMVTIFTGRSKSGKSMFLAHWYNYLGKKNIPILIVPLEDKYEVTIKRMAGNLGCMNIGELDSGGRYYRNRNDFNNWAYENVSDSDIEKGQSLLREVSKYPIHFWDKKVTPYQLRGIAIRFKRKHNIQAMFIDGAKDLLRPSGKYGDVGFDEEISQQLCAIAEELDIAVISVHHLTKINDGERINVNHIRGSGNIVGDSRAVYALQSSGIENILTEKGYSPTFDNDGNLRNRIFECLVNNHGSVAMKALDTDLNKCQFYELRK
mgnify:CR=1 FL=1